MYQACLACILHLPERTYCSPYFSHLPSEGKEILLAIQDRNANLNVLTTGRVHLTLGASVFLKPLANCPKVVTDRPETGLQKERTGQRFLLGWLWFIQETQWHEFRWMVVSYHFKRKQATVNTVGPPIHGFCICKFNQPQIKNTRKKNSRKFQKVELKLAVCWALCWIRAYEVMCRLTLL